MFRVTSAKLCRVKSGLENSCDPGFVRCWLRVLPKSMCVAACKSEREVLVEEIVVHSREAKR